jgi:hypothetical protein
MTLMMVQGEDDEKKYLEMITSMDHGGLGIAIDMRAARPGAACYWLTLI